VFHHPHPHGHACPLPRCPSRPPSRLTPSSPLVLTDWTLMLTMLLIEMDEMPQSNKTGKCTSAVCTRRLNPLVANRSFVALCHRCPYLIKSFQNSLSFVHCLFELHSGDLSTILIEVFLVTI
jgi:hypothetical protein